jgi:hypothetical protein
MIVRKLPPGSVIEHETFDEFVIFESTGPSGCLWGVTIRNCVFREGFYLCGGRFCTFEGNVVGRM